MYQMQEKEREKERERAAAAAIKGQLAAHGLARCALHGTLQVPKHEMMRLCADLQTVLLAPRLVPANHEGSHCQTHPIATATT